MDTDELSLNAYQIIIAAGKFDDTLQTLLGAESSHSSDEENYLQNILEMVLEIQQETSEYLEYWGLEEIHPVRSYRPKLKHLEIEIRKVMSIPLKDREFEKW